jgi:CopG family transcriptional regulator/antitoxin EndoAI
MRKNNMKSNTVNISFRQDLLQQIDQIAKEESRTRSELIREAARNYIESKRKWNRIFSFSAKQARKNKLKEADILTEIEVDRKTRK